MSKRGWKSPEKHRTPVEQPYLSVAPMKVPVESLIAPQATVELDTAKRSVKPSIVTVMEGLARKLQSENDQAGAAMISDIATTAGQLKHRVANALTYFHGETSEVLGQLFEIL